MVIPRDTTKFTVKIDVLDRDIRRGEWLNPFHCPIARSLRRTFRGCTPCVIYESVRLDYRGVRYYARSTKTLQRFIERFDTHKPVKPARFTLHFEAQ